jgi:uncharacterized protein with ParB-like and HNH nuclease domain
METKSINSQVFALKELLNDKFSVDFYQRDYVWQTKQIEDLIQDLSNEFLKNWRPGHELKDVYSYDPYFMGAIVLSTSSNRKAIIDGQQRITTLTLLLIHLLRNYGNLPKFPSGIKELIYSDFYGDMLFNLDIEERRECMLSLFNNGDFELRDEHSTSIKNLLNRFEDIEQVWNEEINENNVIAFTYWVKEKIVFSKVWTNSDEFAYIIFESMNDRGLSLTQVEMIRSYVLANINPDQRKASLKAFDKVVEVLVKIKLSSKSKAEFDFFKIYFRGHFAEDLTQGKNSTSDFTRIGKEFHRWLRDNEKKMGLKRSEDFVEFINKIEYFARVYEKINRLIQNRDAKNYLYLIINADYNFTLQPALILSAIAYKDTDEVIEAKIQIISKYLTKVLTWRTWNHWMISQSSMEAQVYQLTKKIRQQSTETIKNILHENPLETPNLGTAPVLNRQIKHRLKVLLSLITEIVAKNCNESDYILNYDEIEVEHIWADHFEQYTNEFDIEDDFIKARNTIGALLVLPKSFNASYNDSPYSTKVNQYFSQNILAQSLNSKKYENAPGFLKFLKESKLNFKPYELFTKASLSERSELYKSILLWNWSN